VLLAGGVLGSALRFTIGPDGWGLMQPGSTPRLLFTIVVALVALWVALAVTSGPSAGFRFASLTVLVLLGGRLLEAAEPAVMLTAIAGVARAGNRLRRWDRVVHPRRASHGRCLGDAGPGHKASAWNLSSL